MESLGLQTSSSLLPSAYKTQNVTALRRASSSSAPTSQRCMSLISVAWWRRKQASLISSMKNKSSVMEARRCAILSLLKPNSIWSRSRFLKSQRGTNVIKSGLSTLKWWRSNWVVLKRHSLKSCMRWNTCSAAGSSSNSIARRWTSCLPASGQKAIWLQCMSSNRLALVKIVLT